MTIPGKQRLTLLFLLPVLSFLWLVHSMSVLNRNVGPTHDELWDYAPAVHLIHSDPAVPSQEIQIFNRPIPLVTGPYQGALKTWLVTPLLSSIGHDIWVFRFLNVIIALIFLLSLYWCLAGMTNRYFAFIVFLVPFLDSDFLLVAPMDFGPFLAINVFIALSLGAAVRYVTRQKIGYLWLAAFCCGEILASKLTAIPAALAIALLLLVVSLQPGRMLLRQKRWGRLLGKGVLLPCALFLLPLIPHLVYFERSGVSDLLEMTRSDAHTPFFAKLAADWSYFASSFNGLDWYNRLTLDSRTTSLGGKDFVVLSLSILLVVAACLAGKKEIPNGVRKNFLGSLVLFAAALALFAFFKSLYRPWHYRVLEPFFWISVFMAMFVLGKISSSRIVRALLIVYMTGTTAVAIACSLRTLSDIGRLQGAGISSPGIYRLPGLLSDHGVRKIYCLNYSLGQPIYTLDGGGIVCVDLAWTPLTTELVHHLFDEISADPKVAVVYRTIGSLDQGDTFARWLNRPADISLFLKASQGREDLTITTISDRRDTHFYVVERAFSATKGSAGQPKL